MTTLTELRDFASELGLELIYMIGRSKKEFENVTHRNFSPRKNIGLSKGGKLYLLPIEPNMLSARLQRAVKRLAKKSHTSETKKSHGITPD